MEQMATQMGGRREMEERAYKKGSAKPSVPGRHGSSAVEKEMADKVRTLSCKNSLLRLCHYKSLWLRVWH